MTSGMTKLMWWPNPVGLEHLNGQIQLMYHVFSPFLENSCISQRTLAACLSISHKLLWAHWYLLIFKWLAIYTISSTWEVLFFFQMADSFQYIVELWYIVLDFFLACWKIKHEHIFFFSLSSCSFTIYQTSYTTWEIPKYRLAKVIRHAHNLRINIYLYQQKKYIYLYSLKNWENLLLHTHISKVLY
jgi:hypothetical protein